MGKVIDVTIDPDIVLDEKHTQGMSDYIKDNVKITLTMAAQKYNCHWSELTWKVEFVDGMPVIEVKPK